MNCEIVKARLSEYYDGELDPTSIAKIQAHLANCEVCECELSKFSTMSEMLRSADSLASSANPAPASWEQFSTLLVTPPPTSFLVPPPTSFLVPAFNVHPKFAVIGAFALVASIALMVSLNTRMPPGAADNNHQHSHLGAMDAMDTAIDFAELLGDPMRKPADVFTALSKRFEGRPAAIDESESLLGYRPAIAQALPSDVRLISNHILKLPQCNCAVGTCSCGPTGCNCAASLCQRKDGTEFLIVEHCETQGISFGELASQWVHQDAHDVQLLTNGSQLIATWVADHRRLTAIGLSDKAEASAMVTNIVSHYN